MSYESTLQNTSRSRWLPFAITLVLIVVAGCGCAREDIEPDAEPLISDVHLDSLLLALIPHQKHRSPRCQEWLPAQKEAIRSQNLDPQLVLDVIDWYRTEISETAAIEGYTTYPLVERWETRIRLDSLVPLTITELTKQPRWPQPVQFHPQRASGVGMIGSLLENFTDAIRMAGAATVSAESFRELCLGFLEIALPDPQIILTDAVQWVLYDLADSLARRAPTESEVANLAQNLLERITLLESVEQLDTFSVAQALRAYGEREIPDWSARLKEHRF